MILKYKNVRWLQPGHEHGLVARAGAADHIHLHIVPHWNSDTNFMPVLADARVISEHLRATYGKLKETLEGMKEGVR